VKSNMRAPQAARRFHRGLVEQSRKASFAVLAAKLYPQSHRCAVSGFIIPQLGQFMVRIGSSYRHRASWPTCWTRPFEKVGISTEEVAARKDAARRGENKPSE